MMIFKKLLLCLEVQNMKIIEKKVANSGLSNWNLIPLFYEVLIKIL